MGQGEMMRNLISYFMAMLKGLTLSIERKFALLSTKRGLAPIVWAAVIMIILVFGTITVYILVVPGPGSVTVVYP
ncbi:MAG: hypothetical protein OK438_01040 [Thaumarchaeota archaeon]|nr:hypothetical protein [Nitrososphaerota archaeon]